MAKAKEATSTIKFKDDMGVMIVNDWVRYSGNRANYQRLSNVLADALDTCPSFLTENTTEEIYELPVQQWNELAEAFREHRTNVSSQAKNLSTIPLKFDETVRARHLDEWVRSTNLLNPNYFKLGELLVDMIQSPEITHDEIMGWSFIKFLKATQQLASHFEAVTSKN